jgi:hypothetical protein
MEMDAKRLPPRSKSPEPEPTYFLNVDLDVFSRYSLAPLAAAFGSKVIQLHAGPHGNHHRAHFELNASSRKSADALIVGFVRLVKALPQTARAVWNRAYRRDFSIGLQAGFKPHSYDLALKPTTLRLVSSVNARVVVTIYAAELPAARAHRDPSKQP